MEKLIITYNKLRLVLPSQEKKFKYAIFYEGVDVANSISFANTFQIRLSNEYSPYSFKVLNKDKYINICYTPLWRKINYALSKEDKTHSIKDDNIKFANASTNDDLLITFSLKSCSLDETSFTVIENNTFGNRIKNKILRYNLKNNSTIGKQRLYELQFGMLSEIIKNPNTIYECFGEEFYVSGFKFIILDSVNGLIGVRKFQGRIFKNRIDYSFNPNDFIKHFNNGDIKVYRA